MNDEKLHKKVKKNLVLSKISTKLTEVLGIIIQSNAFLQYYSFLTSNRITTMGYYRTIDGVKYDAELLKAAEEAVAGKGDGRISLKDAELLLEQVK